MPLPEAVPYGRVPFTTTSFASFIVNAAGSSITGACPAVEPVGHVHVYGIVSGLRLTKPNDTFPIGASYPPNAENPNEPCPFEVQVPLEVVEVPLNISLPMPPFPLTVEFE